MGITSQQIYSQRGFRSCAFLSGTEYDFNVYQMHHAPAVPAVPAASSASATAVEKAQPWVRGGYTAMHVRRHCVALPPPKYDKYRTSPLLSPPEQPLYMDQGSIALDAVYLVDTRPQMTRSRSP